MSDLTATETLGGIAELKYDDTRGLLYLTTTTGGFYAWNPQTASFVQQLSLGGSAGGFDLTPDGDYALVARTNTTGLYAQDILRVNLSTLAVEQLNLAPSGSYMQEGGAFDVAIAADGTALASTLISGSGWEPLRVFASESATISPTALSGLSYSSAPTYLTTSENGRYILLMEGNISDGPLHLYDSQSHSIVASTDLYSIGSSGFNNGKADINEQAGFIAEALYTNIYIFDLNLSLRKNLSSIQSGGYITGVHFSHDGHQLFLADARTDSLLVYDTSSWTQVGSVSLGAPLGFQAIGGTAGLMSVSSDGRLLFLATGPSFGSATGFEAIDLTSRLQLTVTGDASHTHLYGSVGSDELIGSAANDTLTGGGGADVFFASAGNDTVTDYSQAQGDKINLLAFSTFQTLHDVENAAHQQGADTVISLGSGTLTLQGVTLSDLNVGDFIFGAASTHLNADINGDHKADVIFRDPTTGDWGYAAMTANGYDWHHFGNSGVNYAVAGEGDFNGDGVPDVIFRDPSTGDWGYAAMNASGYTWVHLGNSGVAYAVAGTGDFNHDGRSDVLFRDPSTGDWGYAAMTAQGYNWVHLGNSGVNYAVAGTGDFNGDGRADALFRDPSTGDWGYAAMTPQGFDWHHFGNSGVNYAVAGTGDFNGDGITDVLFRDPSTGDWGYAAMSAQGYTWVHLGNSGVNYTVGGTGDFNADGRSDVIFRDASTGDWGYAAMTPAGFDWHHEGNSGLTYLIS